MRADQALELLNQLLWNALVIAGPILLACLAVGVLISVLQVATQLQESTLSYGTSCGTMHRFTQVTRTTIAVMTEACFEREASEYGTGLSIPPFPLLLPMTFSDA